MQKIEYVTFFLRLKKDNVIVLPFYSLDKLTPDNQKDDKTVMFFYV